MTRKSKSKNAKKQPKNKPQPKKKATPFSDTGAIVGNRLASMFNMPMLKGIGRWLGQGVGHIFGSGDYAVVGHDAKYNILTNSDQIPKFSSTDKTNIISHREFIGNISSNINFTNYSFNLNPGDPSTFPWLSVIAAGFQEYKFHGIIFEFKALTTDYAMSGKPGILVMATNYNAAELPFESKIEMESTEFAVSTKPTLNLLHPIECATNLTPFPKSYVRFGAIPTGQDPRLYDLGKTQIAIEGSNDSTTLVGELWVSYCVEFFKPRLQKDIGANVRTWSSARSLITDANPMGTVQDYAIGDLVVSPSATLLYWDALPSQEYLFTYFVFGDTAVAFVKPNFIPDNCTIMGAAVWTPEDGTTSRRGSLSVKLKVFPSLPLGARPGIKLLVGGTLPTTNTGCYLTITQLSTEAQ
jgi:hypothetical protein